MNTSSLLQSKWSPKGLLTLKKTKSIHDSMNRPKIEFIAYIYISLFIDIWNTENIYNLENESVLYLICNHITHFVGL